LPWRHRSKGKKGIELKKALIPYQKKETEKEIREKLISVNDSITEYFVIGMNESLQRGKTIYTLIKF
jgi:hypothetical protein